MKGFKFKGIAAGIKNNGKKDFGIIYSDNPACAAALFTQNKVVAAPVILGRERIQKGLCQAVIVNSGNANCFTGENGIKDATETAKITAEHLGITEELVMVASTGVIGAPLPMDVISKNIPFLTEGMSQNFLSDFSEAILTTDKLCKISEKKGVIRGKEFFVTGVAKGSGMIRPDMATMLAFVCTDVEISADILKFSLKQGCDRSFNRISVDGDTSTNDTVLALANGASSAVVKNDEDQKIFQKLLNSVLLDLAKMIVKDGEGATKLAEIIVNGAASADDAYRVAEAVSHSNLVKTAIYGEDPNWGRIVAAAGRSGAAVDPDKIDLQFGDVFLVEKGVWLGENSEKRAAQVMKSDELKIVLNLNIGTFSDFYLFCDFSENYVKINADYRS